MRFLSYINPHVVNGSKMFEYGDKHGYFIKSSKTGLFVLVINILFYFFGLITELVVEN